MTMNDFDGNGAVALYSPTARTAFGVFAEHDRDSDGELYGVQANVLAKRWNNFDSQANAYFLSGWGITSNDDPGGYVGSQIDWENRRYFVSYENRYSFAKDIREEFSHKARLGIAPYIAEAGALHSWLMLQVDHMPEDENNWRVTPLVRLFKGDYLGEAGISNRGEILFNFNINF